MRTTQKIAVVLALVALAELFLPGAWKPLGTIGVIVLAVYLFFLATKQKPITDPKTLYEYYQRTPTGITDMPDWSRFAEAPAEQRNIYSMGPYILYELLPSGGAPYRLILDTRIREYPGIVLKVPNDLTTVESHAWVMDYMKKAATGHYAVLELKLMMKRAGELGYKMVPKRFGAKKNGKNDYEEYE